MLFPTGYVRTLSGIAVHAVQRRRDGGNGRPGLASLQQNVGALVFRAMYPVTIETLARHGLSRDRQPGPRILEKAVIRRLISLARDVYGHWP